MSAEQGDIDTPQSEEKIRLLYVEYGESLLAADADRYGAMWTDDAIRMPPDETDIAGRVAILNGVREALEEIKYLSFNVEVLEIVVSGQQAFGRGTFTSSVAKHSDHSKVIHRGGKFLSVFLRGTDGLWRFHRDSFHRDSFHIDEGV
jgi:ketosteroid isomerase-like protein